jgi:hypothetical protein
MKIALGNPTQTVKRKKERKADDMVRKIERVIRG